MEYYTHIFKNELAPPTTSQIQKRSECMILKKFKTAKLIVGGSHQNSGYLCGGMGILLIRKYPRKLYCKCGRLMCKYLDVGDS